MKEEFIKKIADAGVIAFASTKEKAADMISAGVGAVELSSIEDIKELKSAYPDILVGYTGIAEAEEIAASGADFYHAAVYCKKCVAKIKEAEICLFTYFLG